MKILVLQTNIPGRHAIWVVNERGRVIKRLVRQVEYHGAETLLVMIEKLLRTCGLVARDLGLIMVVRGPGPFTAVRTGLVVANTMAYILNLKVRGLTADRILTAGKIKITLKIKTHLSHEARPYYGRRPNISKPKTKPRSRQS